MRNRYPAAFGFVQMRSSSTASGERYSSGGGHRAECGWRRNGAHGLARPMPRGLRAVATGRHVAPAAASVLGAVEEDASAARVAAAAHPAKLSGNERIGRVIHDRHHERCERVTTGHEVARVDTVGRELQSPGAGAASEHAVDFRHSVGPCVAGDAAVLGQRAECAAHPARVEQGGGGTSGLLFRASGDGNATVMVNHADGRQPLEHGAKVAQGVTPDAKLNVVGVDEIEPEAITDEDERAAI